MDRKVFEEALEGIDPVLLTAAARPKKLSSKGFAALLACAILFVAAIPVAAGTLGLMDFGSESNESGIPLVESTESEIINILPPKWDDIRAFSPFMSEGDKTGVVSLVKGYNAELTEEYAEYKIIEEDWYNVTPEALKSDSDYRIFSQYSGSYGFTGTGNSYIICYKDKYISIYSVGGELFLSNGGKPSFMSGNITHYNSRFGCVAFIHCDYNLDGETDLLISDYIFHSGEYDFPRLFALDGATCGMSRLRIEGYDKLAEAYPEHFDYPWCPPLYFTDATEYDFDRGIVAYVNARLVADFGDIDIRSSYVYEIKRIGKIVYENGELICKFEVPIITE